MRLPFPLSSDPPIAPSDVVAAVLTAVGAAGLTLLLLALAEAARALV